MKKIIALTIVVAAFAMILGLGVNEATADEEDEVEWVHFATEYGAEVQADATAVGEINVEFNLTVPVGEGEVETTLEVSTAANVFDEEGEDDGQSKIEIEVDGGVPIKGLATIKTHIDGCGELTIDTTFDIEKVGSFNIEETITYDHRGVPFSRELRLEIGFIEIHEAVICGIDLQGDILSDGELEGEIVMTELFELLLDGDD